MAKKLVLSTIFVVAIVGGYFIYRAMRPGADRSLTLMQWFRNKDQHPEWAMQAGQRCGDAPFVFPTNGYIGFLWDDSFQPGHRHQGIDIFAGTDAGITPVYAAYDGYLTRLSDWKSSVIMRVPSDPLKPSRQIWLYYTHMATQAGQSFIVADFPPGTSEVFVPAGTLLGYQGNYSGYPNNPTGVHLHFSIVLDNGSGGFRNELEISNTLDPSPYLGLPLNGRDNQDTIPVCAN